MGGASTKNLWQNPFRTGEDGGRWNNPFSGWTTRGTALAAPKVPTPAAPPPPPDEVAPLLREIARAETQRQLRASKGRSAALGAGLDPYGAPGSRTRTGS